MSFWLQLPLAALLFAAVVVGGAYAMQRAMLFPAPRGYVPPAAAGLDHVREVPFRADDGTRLMMWYAPPQAGAPTVLHFHGNAESLEMLADVFALYAAEGFGAAAIAYRGYPGSEGRPSEAALIADGIEAFDRLAHEHGIDAQTIVFAGYSLGSAVAAGVAVERRPQAMFLVGAMAAIEDVAKHHMPFLPVRSLMRDPFRSADRLLPLALPVFQVHGSRDRTVPLRFGVALHEALPEPKALIVVEGAGHVLPTGAGWDEFLAFLARHRPALAGGA